MRRLWLAPLVAVLLAGCSGKHTPTVTAQGPSPERVARTVGCGSEAASVAIHEMGACIAAHFGFTGPPAQRLPLTVSGGALCLDLSIFQGEPDMRVLRREGVRCIYGQANDGLHIDSNYAHNSCTARAAGIAYGPYLFVEAGDPFGQLAVFRRQIRSGCTTVLPVAWDVEIPGSYENVCPLARATHGPSETYTAPGLSEVREACGTRLWAAEWGTPPFAFGPWRSLNLQQTCGIGCSLNGVGPVDINHDQGLLAQLIPPCTGSCVRAHLRRQLAVHVRLRARLVDLEHGPPVGSTGHECRPGAGRHVHPDTRAYRHACRVWLAHGRRENTLIAKLRRELAAR